MTLRILTRFYSPKAKCNAVWNLKCSLLPVTNTIPNLILKCNLHTKALTKNLKLISNERIPKNKKLQVLYPSDGDRPLTLLYSWMLAKDKYVLKYAKFYTDRGIDVLNINLSAFDLLRPTKGAQIVARDVLHFLHLNPSFGPLLVHGFSVGGYAFNESMVEVQKDKKKHKDILGRFVGQIWDSAADFEGIPNGLSKAMTNNKQLQKYLEKYIRWHMKVNYDTATVHYENSSRMMHQNALGVPGLFLFSKMDVVSTPEMNYKVINNWEAKGMPVFAKCFESSAHVLHYHLYRKDYEEEITAFLEMVGLLEPTKGRAIVG